MTNKKIIKPVVSNQFRAVKYMKVEWFKEISLAVFGFKFSIQ